MKMLWYGNDMSLWEVEYVNICKLCHCSYVHVYENIEIWNIDAMLWGTESSHLFVIEMTSQMICEMNDIRLFSI